MAAKRMPDWSRVDRIDSALQAVRLDSPDEIGALMALIVAEQLRCVHVLAALAKLKMPAQYAEMIADAERECTQEVKALGDDIAKLVALATFDEWDGHTRRKWQRKPA